jgi:hypothetical protein
MAINSNDNVARATGDYVRQPLQGIINYATIDTEIPELKLAIARGGRELGDPIKRLPVTRRAA